jgi:hypothetical protein
MDQEKKYNIQVKTAKVISVIFHPLFIPLYGLMIIFFSPTLFQYLPFRVKEILFFIFAVNNLLIPVSLIPFFRYRHLMASSGSGEKGEKIIPLSTVSLLFLVTSFIMFRLHIPVFLKAYSYSLTFLSIFLLIINLKWDISLHSAGGGALTALVIVLSLRMSSGLPWLIVSSLLVSGIILSSRLKLNIHKPSEVYSGFLLGFVIVSAVLFLLQ